MISEKRVINALVSDILNALDEVIYGRKKPDEVLKLVDQLDDQIDSLVASLAPERITDERFSAAMSALRDLSDAITKLRRRIVEGRYRAARELIPDLQSKIRMAIRLLTLAKAGSPTPLIVQFAPEYVSEVKAPESLVLAEPMAARIYGILVRKRREKVSQLAAELGIDEKTRDSFNRAIAQLIASGYVTVDVTPSGELELALAR